MRIVLYAAVSVDGFIADENGGTDWVKDDESFENICQEFGCIVMGHKTFKEYGEPPFDPLVSGNGVKLLGDCNKELDLQLSSSKTYDDFVHLNYKVSKNE
jgi:hypothetical protein